MTNCSLIEVTKSSFSHYVLQSELPVLVVACDGHHGADRAFLKLLDEWVPQAGGRLNVFLSKVEDLAGLMEDLGILSGPGLLFFYRGKMCYQFIGEASKRELDEVLTRATAYGVFKEYPGGPAGHNVVPFQAAN